MNLVVGGIIVALCTLGSVEYTEAARILVMIPVPSYSHQIPFRPLWQALLDRGHQIVLLTTDPYPNPNPKNFTQISLSEAYKAFRKLDFLKLHFELTWPEIVENLLWGQTHIMAKKIFEHPDIRPMYAPGSNVTFDLVMVEFLYTPALYAFAHKFNCPLIGLSTLGLLSINQYAMGNQVLPSHPATWEMEGSVGSSLSLWQRTKNYIRLWGHLYRIINKFMPQQQIIAETYLGKDVPNVLDILRNASLVFVNEGIAVSVARPRTPNMIPFDSFHITNDTTPLPKELNEFLEDAPNGFIYFSLGTNAMGSSMPREILDIFCHVFSNLPYKVVWKFEQDMPGKPDNIFISKWLPQQSILAHPKIKLFIYQGGIQSTEEAVHYAVPLVAMPVVADQEYQVRRMVSLGVARRLTLRSLSIEAVREAVTDVLNDKGYKQRMLQLRNLVRDKPYDMLKNIVWWTEYVIRHKGAPHLHCSLAQEPWYHRQDLDVIAFLAIVSFVVTLSVLIAIYKVSLFALHYNAASTTTKKEKVR